MALWILVLLAAPLFLRTARELLIPIALAVLISYALEPIVAWLQRHRVPRLAGAALVLLATLGAGSWGVYALKDDAMQVVEAVPKAIQRAREMVLSQLGSGAGAVEQAVNELGKTGSGGSDAVVQQVVSSIFSLAGLVVLLFTAAVVGAATWAVLAWMDVQHAAMWGILSGVFNSIPYFGPVIVSGGLLVVGLVQGGGIAQALQMCAAAMVITSLEGWLLTPPLMGKAERMSALAVFLGLLLWTWLWGAWGTILAVPMLAVVKSVADHTERFKPVGRLMAP